MVASHRIVNYLDVEEAKIRPFILFRSPSSSSPKPPKSTITSIANMSDSEDCESEYAGSDEEPMDDGGHEEQSDKFKSDDDGGDKDECEADPVSGNQSSYPEWSWDHVRTWVAIRRADKYSDDQIRSLAAQDIVMLEKTNGVDAYGSVEEGTLQAAKRIKGVNPKVKILFYLNAMVHYGGYSANENFNEEWAMFNPKQNNNYKWRGKFLSYDHTNLDFREWWIQRALDMVAHDEIDGIFIDGIVKSDKNFLPVKNHGRAYLATANELRKRLPAEKILIGNGLRANTSNKNCYLDHLEYLDGSYLEGWAHQKNLAKTLELMSAALKKGRIIMLNATPHHLDNGKLNSMKSLDDRYDYVAKPQFIGFPLGYFLLIAEPHAHFSYHVGVHAKPKAMCVFDNTRFDAITRKLGKPMGDYVKEGEGKFSREFEYLKVQVNIQTMEGVLTVKDDRGEEL